MRDGPLQLTINTLHGEDDPWPIEWMMFNILNEYLQPNKDFSAIEAARCLDALIPENRPTSLRQGRESVNSYLRELFDLIWKIASQIHYEHNGQDLLVGLFQELKRLPITQAIVYYPGEHLPAWAEFGQWHDQSEMRRALKPPIKNSNPSQQTCDQYVNASAFASRFFKAGLHLQCAAYQQSDARRFARRLALSTIELAVGTRIPSHELLPCHYIAASQWIILATEWLWNDIQWGEVYYYEVTEIEREYLAFEPPRWTR
ncbi:hypothetical protein F5883DRAFT_640578 [Diaporthe sp. PMI_573]|nr:hypothetical protein F5883DRAFT_640578 [Diaporthaceae sp. PMI_573]